MTESLTIVRVTYLCMYHHINLKLWNSYWRVLLASGKLTVTVDDVHVYWPPGPWYTDLHGAAKPQLTIMSEELTFTAKCFNTDLHDWGTSRRWSTTWRRRGSSWWPAGCQWRPGWWCSTRPASCACASGTWTSSRRSSWGRTCRSLLLLVTKKNSTALFTGMRKKN